MCNQQGAGEHGAPSHYLYQENNSVPGTRPGCLLVGGVGRWGGRDEAESGGLDCHPGGSNPRSKVQPSDHLPALVSLPTPTRGGARSKRCNPEEPEPCASEPRKRGARRGVLSTRHPPRGLYPRPAAHPGDSPRARPPSPGSAAPACPRGALSPAGGPRAAPGGGSAAGLGERAAPETAPARAAQVLGAAPGCFLPGPGGGDPRPAGAARAQRRGWQGRPSRFRSIAARLSQPATAWPRLPPRPPGAPSPSGDQGRARLGVWGRSCHPPVGTLAGLLLPGARGWAC